jgi:hypothetical protein
MWFLFDDGNVYKMMSGVSESNSYALKVKIMKKVLVLSKTDVTIVMCKFSQDARFFQISARLLLVWTKVLSDFPQSL